MQCNASFPARHHVGMRRSFLSFFHITPHFPLCSSLSSFPQFCSSLPCSWFCFGPSCRPSFLTSSPSAALWPSNPPLNQIRPLVRHRINSTTQMRSRHQWHNTRIHDPQPPRPINPQLTIHHAPHLAGHHRRRPG